MSRAPSMKERRMGKRKKLRCTHCMEKKGNKKWTTIDQQRLNKGFIACLQRD